MSKKEKNELKTAIQAERALAKKKVTKPVIVLTEDEKRQRDKKARSATSTKAAVAAIQAPHVQRYFRRLFSKRDASKLAWLKTVAHPFAGPDVPIPAIIAPGTINDVPRLYPFEATGFAVANSLGRVYIWLNADGWLPSGSASAGTNPVPQYQFLGNSTSNGGSRGTPAGYTTQTYAGCTGLVATATGNSFPYPLANGGSNVSGLTFLQLPDNFINTQVNNSPTSGNAYQKYRVVSAGLRARPSAPAPGSLVSSGVLLATQQVQGDNLITNMGAAAGSPGSPGGTDAYAYASGMQSTRGAGSSDLTRNPPLTHDQIGTVEWSIEKWPNAMSDDGSQEREWLTVAAIPNQSCCFSAYVPAQAGSNYVGYPQLAILGAGLFPGQTVEFQVRMLYEFHGGISYEQQSTFRPPAVPAADLQELMTHTPHLNVRSPVPVAARPAVALAQQAVDVGDLHPKAATDWIRTGASVIEAATGSTVGELVGEGLGALAAFLL